MFSGASLSDGTSIDGGSHGVEGKDERDKREVKSGFYRVWKECVNEIGDGSDLGSRTGAGLLSLEFH